MKDAQLIHLRIEATVVTVIALGLLATLFVFLQKELHPPSSRKHNAKKIAILSASLNITQRKFQKQVLWEDISLNDDLFSGDAIRTAEQSEAKIVFDDGTELELAENSLVILDRTDHSVNIEFLKGNVFARGGSEPGKSVNIKTKNGNIRVGGEGQSGALNLNANTEGKLEITVAEGTAEIQGKEGSQQINANEKGQLSETGITKQKLSFRLSHPVLNAHFVTEKKQVNIRFEWLRLQDSSDPATLEISRDPKFSDIVFTTPNLKNSGQSNQIVTLKPDFYYWRVTGKQTSDSSETRRFTIMRHARIRLEFPRKNAKKTYFHERPIHKFQWRIIGGNSGGKTTIQLSKTRDFKETLKPGALLRGKRDADGNQKIMAQYDSLDPGIYFWRVLTRYQSKRSSKTKEFFSKTRKYTLTQLERLPAPELLDPPTRATLTFKIQDEKNPPQVRFRWNPVSEANGYELSIGKDRGSKNGPEKILFKEIISTTSWEVKGTVLSSTQRLFWTVRALAAKGQTGQHSAYSRTRSFTINRKGRFELVFPKLKQVFEFYQDKPMINFSWKPIEGSTQYELQISGDRKFRSIITSEKTKKPQYPTDAAPTGKKYWRVRALDDQGGILALSQTGVYRIRKTPLLKSPQKQLPQSNAKMRVYGETRLEFEWLPIDKAKKYRFVLNRLNSDGQFESILEQDLQGIKFSKTLAAGIYRWNVRAIDEFERLSQREKPRLFNLKNPDRLDEPRLSFPARASTIESKEPQLTTFRWETVQGAIGYHLILQNKRVRPGKKDRWKPIIDKKLKKNHFTLDHPLPSGIYVWKVAGIGIHKEKRRRGIEASSQFRIKWTGKLAAPERIQTQVELKSTSAERNPAQDKAWILRKQ